jgi:hypothetical protein
MSAPLVMKKSTEDNNDPFKRLPLSSYQVYLWTESLPRFDDVDDPDEPLATVQAATTGKFPLDSKPLVLIAARKADGAWDQNTEKGKAIRSDILHLSRNSGLLYADSGHHVQLEKPEVVVAAVRQVIDEARSSKR